MFGLFCSIYSGYRLCADAPPIMRVCASDYARRVRGSATDYARTSHRLCVGVSGTGCQGRCWRACALPIMRSREWSWRGGVLLPIMRRTPGAWKLCRGVRFGLLPIMRAQPKARLTAGCRAVATDYALGPVRAVLPIMRGGGQEYGTVGNWCWNWTAKWEREQARRYRLCVGLQAGVLPIMRSGCEWFLGFSWDGEDLRASW